MFLLVSVRHVGAHPGEHQHGVSIQMSIDLGKTFLRISPNLARVFAYLPPLSFPTFWTLSVQRLWFLFWSILNGVTLKLKTSNITKLLESLLIPAILSNTIIIYSISLLPSRSHPWHFTDLLPRASRCSAMHVFLVYFIFLLNKLG